MTKENTISIAASTAAHYTKVAEALISRTSISLGIDKSEVQASDVANFLIMHYNKYEGSTWRLYRSAVNYRFPDDEGLSHLNTIAGGGKKKNKDPEAERLGASKKMKQFPEEMFNAVTRAIMRERKNISHTKTKTFYAMQLGINLGLRPTEWMDACIVEVDGKTMLKIRNAKNSQGRAHGEFRHLILDRLKADMPEVFEGLINYLGYLTILREESGNAESFEKNFERDYNGIRQCIRRNVMRLFPGRKVYPSLYSLRHQFIANCKAEGWSLAEIGAAVGHGSTLTSETHYGKRRYGKKGGVMVAPLPEEVARVRKVQEFKASNRPKPTNI